MIRKCDDFFKWHREHYYSLTFDDVTVRTAFSKVKPSQVSLSTKITKNVTCKNPIVSSAMDTVTQYELAIALAKEGGIGFIHKNMTPEQQAWHVSRVKNELNGISGLIPRPIVVREDDTMNDVRERKERNKYPFSSFLVVDENDNLTGMITGHHFLFCENYDVKVKEIMTCNIRAAPAGTTSEDAFKILIAHNIKTLPLLENKKVVGLYAFRDLRAIRTGQTSGYNMDKFGRLRVGAAISDGLWDENLERVKTLVSEEVDIILVDSAHGDTEDMVKIINHIKEHYPQIDVLAGNISEPESAKRLLSESKPDGLKVGQGPGSICSTRKVAGIGCPQISAVYEIVSIAQDYNVPVCADGGVRYSGDFVKAIAAGAHTVMVGGLLAGTKEAPGEEVWIDGRLSKSYRGMGSEAAMKENKESRRRYRQDESSTKAPVPEGVEGVVPYRGTVAQQVHLILGGIRNGFGYVGVKDVEDMRTKADFRRVTAAGAIESMPHTVQITKRPPNL